MKKLYYSIGLIFLLLAIAYVALFIAKIYQGEKSDGISSVFMMIFTFFMSWTFFCFGRRCKSREKERVAFINETYQKLMDIYDDIKCTNGQKDMLSVKLFTTGVYDFGCYVWDFVTDTTYSKVIRDDAENKLNDLLRHVAELV